MTDGVRTVRRTRANRIIGRPKAEPRGTDETWPLHVHFVALASRTTAVTLSLRVRTYTSAWCACAFFFCERSARHVCFPSPQSLARRTATDGLHNSLILMALGPAVGSGVVTDVRNRCAFGDRHLQRSQYSTTKHQYI